MPEIRYFYKTQTMPKKRPFIFVAIFLFCAALSPAAAIEACTSSPGTCRLAATSVTPATHGFCRTAHTYCLGNYRYNACKSCQGNYALVNAKGTGNGCGGQDYTTCGLLSAVGQCEALVSYDTCGGGDFASMNGMDNCKKVVERCFGNRRVNTCTACDDGYELYEFNYSIGEGCTNPFKQQRCREASTSEEVKCLPGWYKNKFMNTCTACPGNTSSGSGVDTGEPSLLPSCGLTSKTDATSSLGCYYTAYQLSVSIGGGITKTPCKYSDDTGTYEYSQDCYYSFDVSPVLPAE